MSQKKESEFSQWLKWCKIFGFSKKLSVWKIPYDIAANFKVKSFGWNVRESSVSSRSWYHYREEKTRSKVLVNSFISKPVKRNETVFRYEIYDIVHHHVSYIRIENGCEKLRKMLHANPQTSRESAKVDLMLVHGRLMW